MRTFSITMKFGIALSVIVAAGGVAARHETATAQAAGCSAKAADFKAWVNEMPPSTHKLIVTGKVQCPTTGWKVTLVEAKPQGINPSILILALDAKRPSGQAGQMITPVDVRFERAPGSQYQEVAIRGGGPDFTIPVGIVH